VVLGVVVAAVVVSPTLAPYVRLQTSGFFTRLAAEQRGASWSDVVRVPPSLLWRVVAGPRRAARYDRGGLYPGLVLLALAGGATVGTLRARRRRRPARGASTATGHSPWPFVPGALLCLAIVIGPHRPAGLSIVFDGLRNAVPGVASLRDLHRFWIFPLLCLALVAGAGAHRLLQLVAPSRRSLTTAGLVVVAMVELVFRPPIAPVDLSPRATAANQALRRLPAGAVLELPQPIGRAIAFVDAPRELRSLIDGHPRVDGYSGNTPRLTTMVELLASRLPVAELVEPMRRFGVRFFVLHGTARPCAAGYGPTELDHILAALDRVPGVEHIYRMDSDAVVELAPAPLDRRLALVSPGAPRPSRCS
jgi:hypothetical protein